MKEKLFILISVILISGFISSNPLCAEDIKINKKISGKSYKHLELKNNFLKIEIKKIPVITFRTEISGMSKVSAALLGGVIGLVGGAVIGGVIGSGGDDPGNTGAPLRKL